jgi:hypothetical protein
VIISTEEYFKSGVPNLGDTSPWGDARGIKSVISLVHLYQWGDAIEVRGDAEVKRLGTPGLDQDSWSQHLQKVSLDGWENLDNFKKLVSTNEKSWFCLDTTFQSQKSQSRLRNLLRPEIFDKFQQFVSFLIES